MIRLTFNQVTEAYVAASDLMDAIQDKDQVGTAATFIAEVVPDGTRMGLKRIPVTVDRASVLAEIEGRRVDALNRLSALGIDFDPGA